MNKFHNDLLPQYWHKTIHELFEEQVAKTPDAVAAVYLQEKISYRELNERANQLARKLVKLGVGSDQIVGLLTHRSIDMLIGVLATLKAGGAILPIDPNYPQNRIDFMLKNANVRVLLTHLYEYPFSEEIICLNDPALFQGNSSNLGKTSSPKDLLYVIYTSGTTGTPKGVMIEHRNIVNLICFAQTKTKIDFSRNVLQFTTLCFDVCYQEIFSTLLSGGTLFIIDDEKKKNVRELIDFIENNHITVIFLPTSYLKFIMSDANYTKRIPSPIHLLTANKCIPSPVQHIITAGEQLIIGKEFRKYLRNSNVYLHNHYGPAETHVVTTKTIHRSMGNISNVPSIGYPITNTRIYILDETKNQLLNEEAGEIYISGDSVGRGYLNNPDLTAEKFIDDPFFPDAKMYRTGDLGVYRKNGTIEYLGRIDDQVKIRGYRIELGEIESQLLKFEYIKEVVVVAKERDDGSKYLCAYIVSEKETTVLELRQALLKNLPDFMIPTHFIYLSQMPLNLNGKVDRKNLPEPRDSKNLNVNYNASKNVIEGKLVRAWKEIFEGIDIGINDNFFDMGGDSISILRLNCLLSDIFEKDIPLTDLLKNPTIASMTQHLSQIDKKDEKPILSDNPNNSQEIAVIGMAGRFPGAKNVEEFWENLKAGKDSITFFSARELEEAGIPNSALDNPNYIKAKGFLDNLEYFDASFFGYSSKDANEMDPQTRILHECAYEALQNAGYDPEQYKGKIGFFVGAMGNFLWESYSRKISDESEHLVNSFLNDKDYISTRVSYKLNLRGPSYIIQTGCSTSLVTIDVAVKSLLTKGSDMALAGGIAISLPSKSGYLYEEGMIFSPDGHCKPFDKDALGTVFGDGVGLVVLKRLEDAIRDGDTIYAVIKGSATNNDGSKKIGFVAPSIVGQAAVIEDAHKIAGVSSESITYVETHGTGTEIGDVIEIEALKTAFNTTKRSFCHIGSVKSNIGHLTIAAGVTGFIKVVLSLYNKQIPATLHVSVPNPKINFGESPFILNTKLLKWNTSSECKIRRAGVSSFGVGGTNAHIILEEFQLVSSEIREKNLFVLSAKSRNALVQIAKDLMNYLQRNPDINLSDVAYTLQIGRKAFSYRKAFVCESIKEAIYSFSKIIQNPENINEIIIPFVNDVEEVSEDDPDFINKIGNLWEQGAEINWQNLYKNEKRLRLPLPSYPFERKHYWELPKEAHASKKQNIKHQNIEKWFYTPIWKRSFLSSTNLSDKNEVKAILFLDEIGVGQKLSEQLKISGHEVVTVQSGCAYKKESSTHYTINPVCEDDYVNLWKDLVSRRFFPSNIIHLFSLNNAKIHNPLGLTFYSVLYLVKALAKHNYSNDLKIKVISNGLHKIYGRDVIDPIKSTVVGLCKVIAQEHTNIQCFNIDVCTSELDIPKKSEVIEQLFQEILSSTSDRSVAYRDQYRWVETFEQYFETSKTLVKKEGVYLITGGLGHIGHILSTYLAQEFQAKLILVGRSFLPEESDWNNWLATHEYDNSLSNKIRRLQKLKAMGAEVQFCSGDIANKIEMEKIFTEGEKRFGSICGVFHAAGIIEGETFKPIIEISKEECEQQFRPKIDGVLALEEIISHRKIDFCVLFSSLGSILGGLGFAAYAAANIFLDVFAQSKNSSCKWISVNWDEWENQESKIRSGVYDLFAIGKEEGIKSFQKILSMNKTEQIVVSTGDLQQRIKQWVELKITNPEINSFNKLENLKTDKKIKDEITELWQKYLGTSKIKETDTFLFLGGDSLTALSLISKINSSFNIRLSPHILLGKMDLKTLIELIENSQKFSAHSFSALVQLKQGNSEKPLFLAHPASGHINIYSDLVESLGSSQTIYGLQAKMLCKDSPRTVEDISSQYLAEIRKIQPNGPYLLGGFSFGGVLAFEMAQQLKKQHEQVNLLLMIDAPFPTNHTKIPKTHTELLAYLLMLNTKSDYQSSLEILKALSKDEQITFFLEKMKIYDAQLSDPEQILSFLDLNLMHEYAFKNYRPKNYSGDALFFHASDKDEFNHQETEQWWDSVIQGNIEQDTVIGNHNTINLLPGVKKIATRILSKTNL